MFAKFCGLNRWNPPFVHGRTPLLQLVALWESQTGLLRSHARSRPERVCGKLPKRYRTQVDLSVLY